jgi:hypothetical protein
MVWGFRWEPTAFRVSGFCYYASTADLISKVKALPNTDVKLVNVVF